MSQVMDKLKLGDKLKFKGPRGNFALELNEKREIGQFQEYCWKKL